MAGSTGLQRRFFPAHVAGLDTRVWQADGSSTRVENVVFTPRGSVAKTPGIVPLTDWADISIPFGGIIDSLGKFFRNGATELLFAYSDKIAVLQGEALSSIQTGRTIAERIRDGVRFVQVGDILIIVNGRDANKKWDGRDLTPLGIAAVPESPTIFLGEGIVDGIFTNLSWKEGENDHKVEYVRTWVNDHGQESEPSSVSNLLDTSDATTDYRYTIFVAGDGDPPSDDVIESNYYRRVDSGTWYSVQKTSIRSFTWFDHTLPGTEPVDTLSTVGTNLPPPLARFAFPFRGRVYYASVSDPSFLHYSRLINGTPAPESVPATNFIDVASGDGDIVTGWALSQDFAVVFKRNSMFQLTHDKTETPIIAPVFTGAGCVSDRAVASLDGRVFFLSDTGVYVFDGSSVKPISRELNDLVAQLPKACIEDAFAWASIEDRRVYFSVVATADDNRDVWAIHVDAIQGQGGGAAFTVFKDFPLSAALPYKNEVLVSFQSASGGSDKWDLGQWNSSELIRDDAYDGVWDTRWMDMGAPDTDKTFKTVEIAYVQTGNYSITVEWFSNWDDRSADGSTTFALFDSTDGTEWGSGVWATTRTWDKPRVRTKRIVISDLTCKSLMLRFSTATAATPFEIVGYYVEWSTHGRRTRGSDS